MRKNTGAQKGSILCTASNAGLYGFPIAPMYGVSKHAIVGAVRSLAKPLQADGIQINAICPNCIGKSSPLFPKPFSNEPQQLDSQMTTSSPT
jgi:NAD(P)-dependent dehydrogenase (short-subunit alcohol dehydrogenase family)